MNLQRESSLDDAAPTRPEQVFFEDPAVDRMMGVLMTLAMEHYTLHERVRRLERRVAGQDDVSGMGGAAGSGSTVDPDAADFAASLLRPLLGTQLSTGPAGSFTLRRARR